MRAARTNDVAVMKVLLDGGADPFLTLPDRTTTLMIAAGLGYGGLRGEAIRIVVPTPEGAVEAVQAAARSRRGRGRLQHRRQDRAARGGRPRRAGRGAARVARRDAHSRTRPGFTPLDVANGAGGRGGRGRRRPRGRGGHPAASWRRTRRPTGGRRPLAGVRRRRQSCVPAVGRGRRWRAMQPSAVAACGGGRHATAVVEPAGGRRRRRRSRCFDAAAPSVCRRRARSGR